MAQANLGRGYAATKEIVAAAEAAGIAILLLQEPYVGSKGHLALGHRVIQYTRPTSSNPVKSAVVVLDPSIKITTNQDLITQNMVCLVASRGTTELGLVCLYWEGSEPIEPYLQLLQQSIPRLGADKVVVAGDVNSHSPWWGSDSEDSRGEALNEFLAMNDLQTLNTGGLPTFSVYRGGRHYKSFVDVTACSSNILHRVTDWRVDEHLLTLSDHRAIRFTIQTDKGQQVRPVSSTRIYNTGKADWTRFREVLGTKVRENNFLKDTSGRDLSAHDLDRVVEEITSAITDACEVSLPKLKPHGKHDTCPWWTEELAVKKREVTRQRNRIRHAHPDRRPMVVRKYNELKEDYKASIQNAITASWKQVCTRQEKETVWQALYRILKRCNKPRPETVIRGPLGIALDSKGSAEYLAETFFPRDDLLADTPEQAALRREAAEIVTEARAQAARKRLELFTEEEVLQTLEAMSPKKAPGEDGFTADICGEAFACCKPTILGLFNQCLREGYFPSRWKRATTICIPKPGKDDYMAAKSYRPIGLLPVMGKVLEKLFTKRISWEIHQISGINNRQYGFRPHRGTEDALYDAVQLIREQVRKGNVVAVASLDIEGAFDGAWWPAIIKQLKVKGVSPHMLALVGSYLSDRRISLRFSGETTDRHNTKGCVQGSTCGPLLWNVLLDPIFGLDLGLNVHTQAFADDILLVAWGSTGGRVEAGMNQALGEILSWGNKNKLRFAAHKTQAMVATRKLKYTCPVLEMGGVTLKLSDSIRVLGITLDRNLNFGLHLDQTTKKAAGLYRMVATAARAQWGLNSDIVRLIYTAVVEPTVLYAANIWADSMQKRIYRKKLERIQRLFAIKITKSHRTVSLNSSVLLARILPLDLRAQEQKGLFEIKRGRPIEEIPDATLEERFHPLDHPHPSQRIGFKFCCAASIEDIGPYQAWPSAYTDGSKIEGKVGMAVSVWVNGAESRYSAYRLSDYCSVYQAELAALLRATEMLTREKKSCILSDSRSALEGLAQPDPENPITVEIQNRLREALEAGREIRLFWVKAHVGIPGNERADELAKKAALKDKRAPVYDRFPISFARRVLRERTEALWQARYLRAEGGSGTRLFFRDVKKAYKILGKLRMDNLNSLIFTGHGGMRQYLHRFKIMDSPLCVCGLRENETVVHVLLECPRFAAERLEIETRLGSPITDLASMVGTPNMGELEAFVNYARDVIGRAAKSNGSSAV